MKKVVRLKKHLHKVAVILVAVVLNGCGPPKLNPVPDGGTVLAFGDSLTLGVGTSKSHSYPSVLAVLSGLKVINSGVSGETTDDGLIRLSQQLNRTTPDLIILIEGGNDILRNRDFSEIKSNLTAMIVLAKSKGIPLVLIGIPQKKLFSSSAAFYEELAEEFQLVFDGSLIANLQRSPSLKSDYVHFNQKGYRKMAESIFELLRENGALS